ncbi:hypothetical protein COCNU_scaffold001176G000010 [Cocos nucifera]|nr:hypothetical protein [Cocos nucifera]
MEGSKGSAECGGFKGTTTVFEVQRQAQQCSIEWLALRDSMIESTSTASDGLQILVELHSGGFTSGEKFWHEFRALVMHNSRWSSSPEKSREGDATANPKGFYNSRMVPRNKHRSLVVEAIIPKASRVHYAKENW